MKANELRIGNFIQANGQMMEVRAIYEDHIELYLHGSEADNWDEDLDVCEGVPLTPEILEKCGFIGIKPHDKDIYQHNGLTVVLTAKRGNLTMWTIEGQEPAELNRSTDSLHQLQNIYYALTGIELQFTHPKQTQV